MHTEKEAQYKRCCVTGCGDFDPAMSPANVKSRRNVLPRYCIGSECMGWRWSEALVDGPDSYQAHPGPKGYCGRAGLHAGLE